MTRLLPVASLVAALVCSPALSADEPAKPVAAPAAFDALKALVGTWQGEGNGEKYTITYRLTGGGSALVETFFPGGDHEMVSVYHLDGPDLKMTHYCAVGNQPRMKLDRAASTPTSLVFAFDGGSNLDPAKDMHIHEGKITIRDADHLVARWTAFRDGKPVHGDDFVLTRQK
jgi:hypothetical protein